MPWKDIKQAQRHPEEYPSLFFRNFPWEATRYCCVVMQVSDVMITAFLMAPLITIRRYSGVGWQGGPAGWIVCNDDPAVDEIASRLIVMLGVSSAANVAQFVLVGRAHERTSRKMAKHEHETEHVLPWPDSKLRSSSDILKGLGWRLFPSVIASFVFLTTFFMRNVLVPVQCDNFPPATNAHDSFFSRLF
jgi:hypothetical protein